MDTGDCLDTYLAWFDHSHIPGIFETFNLAVADFFSNLCSMVMSHCHWLSDDVVWCCWRSEIHEIILIINVVIYYVYHSAEYLYELK